MDGVRTDDTRGIIDPETMLDLVDFARHPPGDGLEGIIEWFWSVSWHLPEGDVHVQRVLNHPAGNVSVGTIDDSGVPLDPAEGRVYGIHRRLGSRRLSGAGWTVAGRTTVGGLGVVLDGPARAAADRQLPLDVVIGPDSDRVVAEVSGESTPGRRVDRLREALTGVVATRDPVLVAEAVEVAAIVAVTERDRSICRVEQLAALVGVSVRSLQRLFDLHVGASPSFVIRRWRIIEAADQARLAAEGDGDWRGWAEVAAELGYADQAHLTRDFTAHLGVSPAAHVAGKRPS